jgi:LPXTG-site transpeptidase (sortase) family protein
MPAKISAKKILSKWPLLIAGFELAALAAIVIFFLAFNLPEQNFYTPSASAASSQIAPKKQTSPGIPVNLKIPKIKVNAILEQVGLTAGGAVDVPKGPYNAAWYKLSPRPGDIGSAVITGHYGVWKYGKPTVFNNLYKLRKGDKIYVKDKNGTTITFVVRELRTYGDNDDATAVFVSGDGKAHLNLITCQGVWNKVLKSYPKRLVVFTDKL